MMKKIPLILILLLALSALAAGEFRTVRVTVVNKSGMPVDVSLTGRVQENIYYVRLPEGDRTSPSEAVVDIVPDDYSFKIYYIELWDPVYGSECGEGSNYAQVTHSTRLTVLECSNKTPNNGEPPNILKYPQGPGHPGFRRR
jgi:hypothetical protein